MSIRLQTLGGLNLYKDGTEMELIRSWKRRLGLLIYLAYQGEATRDQLTGLFWPEKSEDRARSSLSTAISDLRKACGRDCILTKGEIYRAADHVELDAKVFQEAVEGGDYQQALELYGGPFLSSISLAKTSAFEQWVGSIQSRLTGLHRRARHRLIEDLTGEGKLFEALQHARRWVELEPEDDGPVQTTMRLLAMDGRRAEALDLYEIFEKSMALQDEEPLEETKQLAERIRSGEEVGPVQVPVERKEAPQASGPPPPTPSEEAVAVHKDRLGGKPPGPPTDAGPSHEDHPWLVELAETLKDWWVFRGVLTFFTFAFIAIGVADGLGVPPVTVRQLLAVSVGVLVLLAPSLWAVEPWLREQLGFGPPRTWRDRPGDPTRGLWRRRAWLISGAGGLVGVVLALALWPANHILQGDPVPGRSTVRLAFLPLLPADSADQELANFAEEISQETIRHFRSFDALEVPGWRRVVGYRDPTLSPDSILNELGVDYFLSGEVSILSDSIRIRWDLEDGQTLGEQIEVSIASGGTATSVSVLTDVVRRITTELREELGTVIQDRELRLGTQDPDAWDAFEEGRRASNNIFRLIPSDPVQAVWTAREADSLLALASSLDPAWVEPLVLRAITATRWAAVGLFHRKEDTPAVPDSSERAELGRQAREQIEEALTRDPENRQALYTRASLYLDWGTFFERLDPESEEVLIRNAQQDLERAVRGSPPYPEAMGALSILLSRDREDFPRAIRLGREALAQDPWLEAQRDVSYWLSHALFELGDDEAALAPCSEAARRETLDTGAAWMLAECQLGIMALGNLPRPSPDSALAILQRTVLRRDVDPRMGGVQPFSEYRPRGLVLYAGVLQAAGLPDSARAVLNSLDGLPTHRFTPAVLARFGDPEKAFSELERYLATVRAQGPELAEILNSRIYQYLKGYPPFDSLREASH